MRSSSVNWLSRSSGSSHLNAPSLIWVAFGSRCSAFSASWDIDRSLVRYLRLPEHITCSGQRAARGNPASAAYALRRVRKTGYLQAHAPVAQLDRALPSEGRGRGFESLPARQFSGFSFSTSVDSRQNLFQLREELLPPRFGAAIGLLLLGGSPSAPPAAGFRRASGVSMKVAPDARRNPAARGGDGLPPTRNKPMAAPKRDSS